VKNFRKFFLEMTPLGVKACGKSEFNVYEAKKCFSDSGKDCIEAKSRKNRIFTTFLFNIQAFSESTMTFPPLQIFITL
jgi:hypothetical protein